MSKKLLSFFIILFLSISIPVTHASEAYCHVEGDSNLTPPIIHDQIIPNIVQEDLHLTDENSPYYVNSKIQIANGVTVTIDPGVVIRGNSVESFELFGNAKLIAKGTDLNKIKFINITLTAEKNSLASVEIEYANLDWVNYNSFSSGLLILKNSNIYGYSTIKVDQPSVDSFIENNLFLDSNFLSVTPSVNNSISIKNNTFKDRGSRADILFNYKNSGNQNIKIEGNNFLGINKQAIQLVKSEDADSLKTINAQYNYWGTSNLNTLESKIFDRNDDLNLYAVVDYQNFLNEYNKNAVPYPLDKPKLDKPVGDSDTVIKGKAEANLSVIAKINNIEIASSSTDEQGKFSLTIEKQKAGTIIDLTAQNSDGAISPVESVSVRDYTGPEAPIVNEITDQSRSITGKTEPFANVGTNPVYNFIKADNLGNFTIPIGLQKPNTMITIYTTDAKCMIGKSTTVRVIDITAPAAPILRTVLHKPDLIIGNTEPFAKVKALLPNKKVIYGTADQSGYFIVNIGTQKPYTPITFYAIDEANHISKGSIVKVLDTIPPSAPKVNKVTVKSRTITGTTEPYVKVKIMVGKKQIALVNSSKSGRYSAPIIRQKYNTSIKIYSIDKAGNISKGTTVKVRK
ncbi:Ig-like domain-containing protein [Bacillus sp. EAC]|uniref:Ig-like domain-containing protein n=1 Tax=Bacillus sp. EAC TaxID=1978338 RepID=UPI000B436F70|nr:Ig-like domain-containing protein [Bacillus sp. EAC]